MLKTNSGIDEPHNLGETRGVWETHLCQAFRNGLRFPIASGVTASCVGLEDACLHKLSCHAKRAQKLQEEKRIRQKVENGTEKQSTLGAGLDRAELKCGKPPTPEPTTTTITLQRQAQTTWSSWLAFSITTRWRTMSQQLLPMWFTGPLAE